jgi:hypothetical protein
VVEDFDAATQPSQKRSTQRLDSKNPAVSLLIRISHKARPWLGRWRVVGQGLPLRCP